MFDLTDKYIHWQLHGEIGNWVQGHVVGNVSKANAEPIWVVQLFSWLTGGTTNKIFITNPELADGFVRIYDDINEWRKAGDKLPDGDA